MSLKKSTFQSSHYKFVENTNIVNIDGHESNSINFNIENIYIPYMGGWTLRSLESLGSSELSSTVVPFCSGNIFWFI
jgi:hypothetical protein